MSIPRNSSQLNLPMSHGHSTKQFVEALTRHSKLEYTAICQMHGLFMIRTPHNSPDNIDVQHGDSRDDLPTAANAAK